MLTKYVCMYGRVVYSFIFARTRRIFEYKGCVCLGKGLIFMYFINIVLVFIHDRLTPA